MAGRWKGDCNVSANDKNVNKINNLNIFWVFSSSNLERYRYEIVRRKWKSRSRTRRGAAFARLLLNRYGVMISIRHLAGTAQGHWGR